MVRPDRDPEIVAGKTDHNRDTPLSGVAAVFARNADLIQNVDVSAVLPIWTRPAAALKACFPGAEYQKLLAAYPSREELKRVVILSYENPKGASGGIKAVVDRMPAEMRRVLQSSDDKYNFNPEVIRVSPLHTNLVTKYKPEDLKLLTKFNVPFNGHNVETSLHLAVVNGEEWYLFEAPGYFAADGGVGGTDPYVFSIENQAERDGDRSRLLLDSLFASRAVPEILVAMGLTKNVIVHAQDWQFATAALTVKEAIVNGLIESAASFLTLHNPYDHGVTERNIGLISTKCQSGHWPQVGGQDRPTVLTRMIPLLDAPPSVVSHRMAQELTASPQQTGTFTGHAQGVLKSHGRVGIDNGNFFKIEKSPFSPESVLAARRGNPELILSEKLALRSKMLDSLGVYISGLMENPNRNLPIYGHLDGNGPGQPLNTLPDNVPVFMMPGRLDPGQKGYDVVARIIDLVPPGYGRFVLTPMSPLAGDYAVKRFMDDMVRLTELRKGEVVVLAHRMEFQTYLATMAGCTWSLWPSLYEPFGGANEFYEKGTPVIAHAVGGLTQQVICYSKDHENATGLLYKERLYGSDRRSHEEEYRRIHEAGPAERMHVPLYQAQVASLAMTIAEGVSIWRYRPDEYGKILANLFDMCLQLGWDKPVKDYLAWYEGACK